MPRCLLWKRVPGYTVPMVPMHLPPMAPMNLVEQIRALLETHTPLRGALADRFSEDPSEVEPSLVVFTFSSFPPSTR
jgi:hypothetical protein